MAATDWTRHGDFEDIAYETADGLAKAHHLPAEVRNAFRPQTLFELSRAFDAARDDPRVGVIILTVKARTRSAPEATSGYEVTTAISATTRWRAAASAG